MNKKEFFNRRNAIKEDFRVRVDKEGDHLSVDAEGEDSQEFFDFARCLFGDNFDSFNCDFSDPIQPEQQTEVEIPEVDFDYEAEDQIADVDDPFTAFDEPVEEAPVEEPTEEAEEVEEEQDEEAEEEDHKDEKQPMDMINGKLVPAKDPTASEVEIDDEDEDDDEDDDDEDEEELEEDLNVSKYDCYYKDEFVGSVYAMSEDEAYSEMEKVWPELNYGEYDGVANVVLSEDFEGDSEEDFLNAFGEAFYGKRKDLNEAGLGLKNKIKNFAAGVKRAFTTTKVLDNIIKFQVKELDSDGKVIKTYEAKNLADAEKLATAASKKSNVDKAQVVAVDYIDQKTAKKYKDETNPMLFIDSSKKKELALETFRDGEKSVQTGEYDVTDEFIQELNAVEQTAKAKTVKTKPEEEPEKAAPGEEPVEAKQPEETAEEKEPEEVKQPEVQQKDTKGVVLNRKIKRNKAIKAALDKAGFDTSSLVNGKKASDKLNTIRKDLFGEGLQEDYEPESEEEKALWGKLSDNYCGPGFEYELTYNGGDYENSRIVPAMRQTYDGDYEKTGFILTGTYNGDFYYDKAPTYEDVLEFLGEDHLTEEGVERLIADDKKEAPEFIEFLTDKYEDEAVEKFYEDLEDGEYDDQIDWEEEWPEPDYDYYDD